MRAQVLVVLGLVCLLTYGVTSYAIGQGDGTGATPGVGTPGSEQPLCATPVAQTDATPATIAAVSGSSPEAGDLGTPIGLYPCATPVSTPSGDAVSPADAPVTAIQVDFVDIAFSVSEITIPADTDVTFTFTNLGASPHNFVIEELGIDSGDLPSGETSSLTVNVPAGTYEYVCTIPGHEAAGMVGTLYVE